MNGSFLRRVESSRYGCFHGANKVRNLFTVKQSFKTTFGNVDDYDGRVALLEQLGLEGGCPAWEVEVSAQVRVAPDVHKYSEGEKKSIKGT